jgi:hypothetical protein
VAAERKRQNAKVILSTLVMLSTPIRAGLKDV